MSTKPSHSFKILPVFPEDVETIAKLGDESFETDRQTQMKTLGSDAYNHGDDVAARFTAYLQNPRCVLMKTVDDETGDIMGFACWGFRGWDEATIPRIEGAPPIAPPAPVDAEAEEEEQADDQEASKEETDPVKRLEALTDASMNEWMERFMPPGTRCMYVVSLTVHPRFQGRGAGGAMLRWATAQCDKHNVFCWVHSSEPAWGVYAKVGFEVVGKLEIDLDEYAPCPPPGEGEGAKWGPYVFRYMVYGKHLREKW